MSDALFALERCVHARVPAGAGAWHVDRSRNDVQACAQLMYGRERLLQIADATVDLARATLTTARRHTGSLMPGYTQHQAAQAITFGFYLTALAEAAVTAAEALVAAFTTVNLCPLGAGALAGLELPWDRDRLADALGFAGPQPHALTSVASRGWVLRAAAELSVLGTTMSRFLTDLMWWSGSSCRFVDLPDALAGISSAMPHKRNFPVLERVRGMCGHLSGLAGDLMTAQRNTGYTNLVEVSKEGTRYLEELFSVGGTMLALFAQVVASLRFDPRRAEGALSGEVLAASTIANHLTLEHGVPARTGQIAVGAWISATLDRLGEGADLTPAHLRADDLAGACARLGFPVTLDEARLRDLLDAGASVRRRRTSGSTHPDRVHDLLDRVEERAEAAGRSAAACAEQVPAAWQRTTGVKAGDST